MSQLHPGLVRLARTYVPHALAEEVAQDTWSAVITSIDRFEGRSSLKTWVYRILLNKVRTLAGREAKIVPFAAMGHSASVGADDSISMAERLQSQAQGPGHWSQPPEPWKEFPEALLERAEVLERIEAAIAELTPSQREVVELRDVQGLSADEVCNALGISSVNQRVLLHRGRVAVRAMLEEYLSDD